jgi:UDP-N-acetylmuramoylalanine--D-glutamate ligase
VKNGVSYINDSKGTNVGAVLKSVEGFTRPVILIAGGLDKGSDFSPLYDLFKHKVKLLILIGKAADKMAKALGTSTKTVFAQTLQDAVRVASVRANKGDVVLLSPACASFDMFKDFEDRGRQFKEAVMGL